MREWREFEHLSELQCLEDLVFIGNPLEEEATVNGNYTQQVSKLCCTALHCTVLYCTQLYCTVLCCTVLYYTVLYCTVKNVAKPPLYGYQNDHLLVLIAAIYDKWGLSTI